VEFDAIIFDFGNTLVPWGQEQGHGLYAAVREALPPIDDFFSKARQAHMGLVRERENGSMREVTCAEFVNKIMGAEQEPELIDHVAAESHRAFVELCAVPPGVRPLLERLQKRYKLAVLSNFFLEGPVEEVLRRAGLWELFVHVEISAREGFMKPHPAPFDTVRAALDTEFERTLMVGDDFFADVVGGYRAGLLTALTHQYAQAEPFDTRAPEVSPDRILSSLDELADQS
jgi:HAD superfamily hydrolase (TIGR01549 family)